MDAVDVDFSKAKWINKPKQYKIKGETVEITTEPGTDFWQRSFYGFRNDNAPALLLESGMNFTFVVRAGFEYRGLFDQCGVVVYLDELNWFKASVECDVGGLSRLGSVVTNLGYSDWATRDIVTPSCMWYRLSRRGPDFLIESSPDGIVYTQMRIFHMHNLGETTEEMGKSDPPLPAEKPIRLGLYACSPLESTFTAKFNQITLTDCQWQTHKTD